MRNIIILLFIFSIKFCQATHMAGGELSYTHISGLTYKVKLKLYRDCAGSPMPAAMPLKSYSVSLGQQITATLSPVAGLPPTYFTSFCANAGSNCTGGINPGYEFKEYTTTITLPAAAADWGFSTSICCRNVTIDNLYNPPSYDFCINSFLNNLNIGNWNNSAQFTMQHGLMFNTNQTYTMNQTAIDIDGDSLEYSLVAPLKRDSFGVLSYCTYEVPYTFNAPFPGSISINSQNGNLIFNCNTIGTYVVVIRVNEYRNGVLVGSIIRDLQLTFLISSPNNIPQLSGVNGGINYQITKQICAGTTLSFDLTSFDLDPADSIQISLDTSNIPGSTLTLSNAMQPMATFTWNPTIAQVRPQPYLLGVQVRDNHCNLNGIQNFGYLIYLKHCNIDTVWPGDANADFVVNNYDVLNLGLAFGSTGVVRPGASTNWTAQYCPNWVDTFMNGVNYKHADCDGDGTVGNTDWPVITLNYGQFHFKSNQLGQYKTRGLPDLFFDTNGLEATPGGTLQVPVHLGSVSSPMNNIYGIAGKIMVSNTLSNNITLSNSTSWIGTAANSYLFQKNSGGFNATEFALVKTNQQAVSGNGQIATLTIPIDANASIGSDLILDFANLKLIDNEGKEITDYNALSDTLKIVWPTKVNSINEQRAIKIYPNPVSNLLTVEINTKEIASYEIDICDITGKSIYTHLISGQKHNINTASFSKGVYFVKIVNDKGTHYSYKISK